MVIGLFLMLGAVTVYNQSRTTYRASEGVARLQEVARLALDVMESDVRMANFWGLNSRADYIVNQVGDGETLPAEFSAAQGGGFPRAAAPGATGRSTSMLTSTGPTTPTGWRAPPLSRAPRVRRPTCWS